MGALYDDFKAEAEKSGYFVNGDVEFVEFLLENLKTNEERYGYASCPCRLSTGIKEADKDLICPCDYRDMDLNDFGSCYCALYVSKDVHEGRKEIESIPDRRFDELEKEKTIEEDYKTRPDSALIGDLKYPVYRCKVCGYLCARENPPDVCPICKADSERFERFL